MSLDGAPSARADHVAVWTGAEMIVFGGDDALSSESEGFAEVPPHPLADGGAYDPRADRWRPLPTSGAPVARSDASAVWTGAEMLIFGGLGPSGVLGDGYAYDPASDRWRGLAPVRCRPRRRCSPPYQPSPRRGATAVWTGAAMVVFGGSGPEGVLGDGGLYDPSSDRWRPLPDEGAPCARSAHTALWTGREVIVFGGRGADGALGDGAAYDPVANRWRPLPLDGAPSARADHVAVWTGREMIVFGGRGADGGEPLATGGRFDPVAARWAPIAARGAHAREGLVGAFAGDAMVVVGEPTATEGYPSPSIGVYDPVADRWISFTATAMLDRPVVSTGRELLLWSGFDGSNLAPEGERIPVPIEAVP